MAEPNKLNFANNSSSGSAASSLNSLSDSPVQDTSSTAQKPAGSSIHAYLRRTNSDSVLVEHVTKGLDVGKSQSLRGGGLGNLTEVAQGEVLNVTLGVRPILARRMSTAKATPQMRKSFLEQAIQKDDKGSIHVEGFAKHLTRPLNKTKWVADDAAEGCQRCKKAFGLFRRRHHCRYCGWLVCLKCSKHKLVFRVDGDPLRTCERCLHRIIGRIDALYDRRYMRAVIGGGGGGRSSAAAAGTSRPSDDSLSTRDRPKENTFWTPPPPLPVVDGGSGGGDVFSDNSEGTTDEDGAVSERGDDDDNDNDVVSSFVASSLAETLNEDGDIEGEVEEGDADSADEAQLMEPLDSASSVLPQLPPPPRPYP